jgi:DNA (cytosine-5)-methyltransferase 1
MLAPMCQHGQRSVVGVYGGHLRNRKRVRTIGVYGEGVRDSVRKVDKGGPDFNVDDGRKAMGIDWMTIAELCQAIPPAYSEWIGRRFLEAYMEQESA